MPEQEKRLTLDQKIKTLLCGDTQKNALDFSAFLRTNKIPPRFYVFNVVGDGGNFPHIRPWVIFFNVCEFNGKIDEDLAEFAWAHAHICDHFISNGKRCGCGKQPGSRRTVFGKEMDHICHCPMQFINPDAKELENMKKLLLLLKNAA